MGPSRSVRRLQVALGAATVAMAVSGAMIGLALTAGALVVTWVVSIIEANRLEATVEAASDDVVRGLEDSIDQAAV